MKFLDSLTNLAAQMGTGKSKMASDQFVTRELNENELTSLYRSDWLGRKIVDAPVFDMFREWRSWQAEPKLIEAIEEAEDHWRVREKLGLALRMARLYGGSAIIIGADTARPSMPLTPRSIGKGSLKYLTVVSRNDLQAHELDRDPSSMTFGEPIRYTLNSNTGGAVEIHPSRVIRFIGAERLDRLHVTDGWGDSILAAIYDTIHNAALSQTGIAELVHEAKVDVISIPNLGGHLGTPLGTSQLSSRFTVANSLKSINNMLLLDADEKWDRKQTSFSGLPDILDRYLQIVSGASDIPATRLIGQAPKGMSSTGESDLRNYYDMLAGVREQSIGHQLARLDQILWLDAIGSIPKDAYPEWSPLWQLTPKEKADISKTKADTTKIYIDAGVIDENALRKGVENQLIEDGIYPGLEAAIEEFLQSASDDPGEDIDPEAENDNSQADRAIGYARKRLAHRA